MSVKKVGTLFFSILFFALLVVTASANSNYPNVGGSSKNFVEGSGLWDSLDLGLVYSRSLTYGIGVPLVADLNGDGVNEIIVQDNTQIKIYQGRNLGIVDALDTGESLVRKQILSIDYDGDGVNDVVWADSLGFHFFKFNGSIIQNYTIPRSSNINWDSANDYLVGCRGSKDCLIASVGEGSKIMFKAVHDLVYSNTSAVENFYPSASTSIGDFGCFINPKNFQIADYDNDGTSEYIYTFVLQSVADDDLDYYVQFVDVLANFTPVVERTELIHNIDAIGSGEFTSCGLWQSLFSTAIVYDFDGLHSNGLETVVAYSSDAVYPSNNYKMVALKGTLSGILKEFPDTFVADGNLLSNPVRGKFFPDSDDAHDFCVLGTDTVSSLNGSLDLLCGSFQTSFTHLLVPVYSLEYKFDMTSFGNMSAFKFSQDDFGVSKQIIHSGEYSSSTITDDISTPDREVSMDEIVSSYGVFGLNYDVCYSKQVLGLAPCIRDLVPSWFTPKLNTTVVPVDVENVSHNDMLLLKKFNLYYVDDQFVNSGANITNVDFSPCNSDVFGLNKTFGVTITVFDLNGDYVASRGIAYFGDANAQDSGWSANISSGSDSSTYIFNANKTGSFTFRAFGVDTKNKNVTYKDFTFTVANSGLGFGDSNCDYSFEITPSSGVTTTTLQGSVNVGNNTFKNAFDDPFLSSFGFGYTVMWLLIMCVVGGAVWIYGSHISPAMSLGIVVFIEFLLFVIGVYLDFISVGVVVTLVVFGMIAVGIWLSRIFSKQGG